MCLDTFFGATFASRGRRMAASRQIRFRSLLVRPDIALRAVPHPVALLGRIQNPKVVHLVSILGGRAARKATDDGREFLGQGVEGMQIPAYKRAKRPGANEWRIRAW